MSKHKSILKRSLKIVLGIILTPILLVLLYFLVAWLAGAVTVEEKTANTKTHKAYLSSNGVHLDLVLAVEQLPKDLLNGLVLPKATSFIGFGWGDENFYLHTPTWNDLTMRTAFGALFLESTCLMHLNSHKAPSSDWSAIQLSEEQFEKITQSVLATFEKDENGSKICLEGAGYGASDTFYRANGNYHCFNTCNSWVNDLLKEAGCKACYWTPFDFQLLEKYR